jgi:hypothetical protein
MNFEVHQYYRYAIDYITQTSSSVTVGCVFDYITQQSASVTVDCVIDYIYSNNFISYLKQLVERGEGLEGLWAFSEITEGNYVFQKHTWNLYFGMIQTF